MALSWEITAIDDYEAVCWDIITDPSEAEQVRKHGTQGFFAPSWYEDDDGNVKVMNAVTNALIWMMMGLGVGGKITAQNVEEVVLQVAIEQRVFGPTLRQKRGDGEWEPRYITPDEIRAHIGLRTNAFGKDNTKRAFKEKLWKNLRSGSLRWIEERVRSQEEDSEEAA
jgi:hypothetical protein